MHQLRPAFAASLLLLIVALPVSAQPWPGFRGPAASGAAEEQNLPASWDAAGENVRWRTPIPGMGHSSPIVWGERVFVVTAVADEDAALTLGDEGGISLAGDDGVRHSWRVYCLDAGDGSVVWSHEAFSGMPRATRHVKSSQANVTPATDGETLVAIFGSQGMVAYDLDGKVRWQKDLALLDPGLFQDKSSQWGYASSPVIFEDTVIVQVDRHTDSFLAAFRLADGEEVWRVERDEKPVWATPTLHRGPGGAELVVLGGDYDRGYDPVTGEELWRYARDLQVKSSTPVVDGGLIVLAGGYPRGQPLHAIRVGARGDVSLAEGESSSEQVAWISDRGGPYTSTPLIYRGQVYTVRDTGILTALSLESGERLYRERLDGTYSASPVAADGRIYFASEDGTVRVVAAGPQLEIVAEVDMGEPLMATPAIADGTLYVRGRSQLFAIGTGGTAQ